MCARPNPGAAGLLALLLLTGAARADSVDAAITTLLTGHADPRDGQLHTIVPVYESLSVQAALQRRWADELKLNFSGWGAMILDIPRDQRWTGDIDLGYLEGAFLRRRVQLRLGRQLVVGGAARVAQMDGLSVVLRGPGGVGLSAYGGLPVTPRFGMSRGDALVGGRAFYRLSPDAELGLSFHQLLGDGRIARQDLGLDLRLVPHRTLTASAYVLLSLAAHRVAEANVDLLWQPRAELQLSADYRRTAPDLFLPLNSIFAVFSQETRDELGGTLYYRPLARLRFYGDYHAILRDGGGPPGHRGGGKLSLYIGKKVEHSLNGEVRALWQPQNGYVQARLYGITRPRPRLSATLGADLYFLDRAINGQDRSFTATGTLGYDFRNGFRMVLSGMADVTPFVERRFEFVARLAYNFTRRFREVHP